MTMVSFSELSKEQYKEFYASLKAARQENKHGYYVDLDDAEHYLKTRNFLIDGKIGGFALDNGNLVAVHKNPKLAEQNGIKHIMHSLMLTALVNGANKLDCYGHFLAETYMQYGFLPVGKMTFNRDYNPSWPYAENPNVYVMVRAVSSFEELVKMQEQNQFAQLADIDDELPFFDDYDKLIQKRDKLLDNLLQSNLKYSQILKKIRSGEWIYEH